MVSQLYDACRDRYTFAKLNFLSLVDPCAPYTTIVHVHELESINLTAETVQVGIELALYLDPHNLPRGSQSHCWSAEQQLAVNFLLEPAAVAHVGDPETKAACAEHDLMVSSADGCGFFCDRGTSLQDMYQALLRESRHLGVHPKGCLFDEYFVSVTSDLDRDIVCSEATPARCARTTTDSSVHM